MQFIPFLPNVLSISASILFSALSSRLFLCLRSIDRAIGPVAPTWWTIIWWWARVHHFTMLSSPHHCVWAALRSGWLDLCVRLVEKGRKCVCYSVSVCRIDLWSHRKCFYINPLGWSMPSSIYYWHKRVCAWMCVRVRSRVRHYLPVCACVTEQVCVSQRFMSCNILRTAQKDKILQNCIRDTVITNSESYNKHLETRQIGNFIFYNTENLSFCFYCGVEPPCSFTESLTFSSHLQAEHFYFLTGNKRGL